MDENIKIENIKFREKIWADKKSRARQSKPKVSAVSWIISRAFKL